MIFIAGIFTTACPVSKEDCYKQFSPQMDLLLSFHTAGPLPNLFLTSTLCRFLPLVLSGFAAPLSRKSGLGPLPGHPLAPTPTSPHSPAMAVPLSWGKGFIRTGPWLSHRSLPQPQHQPGSGTMLRNTCALKRDPPSHWKRGTGHPFPAWVLVYGTTQSIFSLGNRTNHFSFSFFSLDSIKA